MRHIYNECPSIASVSPRQSHTKLRISFLTFQSHQMDMKRSSLMHPVRNRCKLPSPITTIQRALLPHFFCTPVEWHQHQWQYFNVFKAECRSASRRYLEDHTRACHVMGEASKLWKWRIWNTWRCLKEAALVKGEKGKAWSNMPDGVEHASLPSTIHLMSHC